MALFGDQSILFTCFALIPAKITINKANFWIFQNKNTTLNIFSVKNAKKHIKSINNHNCMESVITTAKRSTSYTNITKTMPKNKLNLLHIRL